MNHEKRSVRRGAVTAAMAAFGVASLGMIGSASADPAHGRDRDRDGLVDRHEDDRGYQYDDYDAYQVGPYGQYRGDYVESDIDMELERYAPARDFDRHMRVDFRRFDRDRSGKLESWERKAYWRHLADMGVLGRHDLAGPVASMAKSLDRDGDGRLTRREVALVRRFVAARRMFERQDRDNDNRLFRREATGWLRGQFARLDRNDDRKVTRGEIQEHFVGMDRDRPRTWSWRF